MDKGISNFDIQKAMGNKVKIINYKDLATYDDIESVFEDKPFLVILYETSDNNGHWVLISNYPDKIDYFDSYGIKPDDELFFINLKYRITNNMLRPHLTHLLMKTNKKVDYNAHQFQSYNKKIATCGRWCIFRSLLKNTKIDDLKSIVDRILSKNPKYKTGDRMVYEITKRLYSF